jgi:2-dehydropantoate 2-reductase
MESVAVIGPGAVGSIVAAWLAQNPDIEVTVCARSPLDDIAIETPDGPLIANPWVLTDPAGALTVDWVLVATKAYDVQSTAPWLERLVGATTRIVVLQNGVEHRERFAGIAAPELILPAVVDIPANRAAPGRVKQHRYGTIFVPAGPDGDAFVRLFAHTMIAVATDPDITSRMWQKLCLNSAGAVSALTLQATGPVWSPQLASIVRALVEECAAVGRAEGANIPREVVDRVVDSASRSTPEGGRNSLEADRFYGRPMELDARNGVIVRLGRKHGIPTPMNSFFVTLLGASGSPWVSSPRAR